MEDNLQTYGLVSGFFQSGFSLGAFVGPSAAGYFAGKFGFPWSCTICGFIMWFCVSKFRNVFFINNSVALNHNTEWRLF